VVDEMDNLWAALIGAALSGVSVVVGYWWKSYRDLKVAAVRCYDRLIKIRNARLGASSETSAVKNEVWLLGGHADLLVASMSATLTARKRKTYWAIYDELVPILVRHDLDRLDNAIANLHTVVRRAN
jgi:hypothetical protein